MKASALLTLCASMLIISCGDDASGSSDDGGGNVLAQNLTIDGVAAGTVPVGGTYEPKAEVYGYTDSAPLATLGFIGRNSLAQMSVSGSILVPFPAAGAFSTDTTSPANARVYMTRFRVGTDTCFYASGVGMLSLSAWKPATLNGTAGYETTGRLSTRMERSTVGITTCPAALDVTLDFQSVFIQSR